MVDAFRVVAGLAFVIVGGLAVVNHPLVDGFNRTVKSMGTKRTPDEIEMSELSIVVGRVAGVLIALYGVGMTLNGL